MKRSEFKRLSKTALLNNEKRRIAQQKKAISHYLIAFWVFCFFSFIYAVFNFHDVLIDYKLPFLLAGFCGLIGIFFTKDKDNYLFAFLGYGSLIISIPLFVNKTFADKETEMLKLPITEKRAHGFKSGPSVTIKYKNFENSFGADSEREKDSSSYVILTVSKGLLGYYVIRDYKLVK
jgi:hypothetical protein